MSWLYGFGICSNIRNGLIMLFSKQIEFIDSFPNTLFKILEQTIIDNDFVIKDYIVNKQLFREGVDGNNFKLEGYKRTTIRLKISKGDPVDRTTLRDSGEFYNHIHIDAFSDRFEIVSDVEHDKFIIQKYGIDVLKVSHENIKEFMHKYFIPNLKNHVNNKTTR